MKTRERTTNSIYNTRILLNQIIDLYMLRRTPIPKEKSKVIKKYLTKRDRNSKSKKIPDNFIISKEIPIDTDKKLDEISDNTSDDIKLSTCNTCTKRKYTYVDMETQTDTITYTKTIVQMTNEYSIFDCIDIEAQTDNVETK
ncbi:10979_t:CDS:1, partial [Racocetra persica]